LEPGVCYRAWSEGAHASLAAFTPPEISNADLAPLALDLGNWGVRDAGTLRWLDAPPAAMLASARDLLKRLAALDASGLITPHGREMSQVAIHPRLAHMLIKARALNAVAPACDLAALLSERDLLRGARDPDIRSRLELLAGASAGAADKGALSRVRRMSQDLARQLRAPRGAATVDHVSAGLLLAFAYPDRIGRRRGVDDGSYALTGGRGAKFVEAHSLSRPEYLVAVDLDDQGRDARILLAAPLTRAEIGKYLSDRLKRLQEVSWDSRTQAVVAREVLMLDSLILEEKPLRDAPAGARESAVMAGIRELGISVLPWTPEIRNLQARMEFVRALQTESATPGAAPAKPSADRHSTDWPAADDANLLSTLEEWLSPWLDGVTRKDHLARIPLGDALRALLTWEQQKQLDALAPSHLEVPTGSRIRIDYLDESAPAVSVRLQEAFGLDRTPLIGKGRVPVTFKLLSPARRPVQVTRDLAGFWRGTYSDVRKDLRGRYPKHNWPTPEELESNRKREN
jgi:ATP-dependent helicase HrpB